MNVENFLKFEQIPGLGWRKVCQNIKEFENQSSRTEGRFRKQGDNKLNFIIDKWKPTALC